ncbi:MAG: hypothetical protein Tsb006_6630 [Rickettsiaceae bacterium]
MSTDESSKIYMYYLRWVFWVLVFVSLSFAYTTQAALPIKIEAKVFSQDVIFVFYHDKDRIIDLSSKEKTVVAQVNIPSEFKILNPSEFSKYASNVKISKKKQKITFDVQGDLEYQNVINGEKLYAIKFKSSKKQEEDLSTIGKANNDPGVIKYSKESKEHILTFNLGNENSKAAAFFRGQYIWVIFDQKKNFAFKESGIFSKFELVPCENGTVLRMMVEPKFSFAKLERTNSGWNIKFSSTEDKNWQLKHIMRPEPLQDQEGILIKGNFADNELITFEDPDRGDLIISMPVATSGNRIITQKDSIEFNLLKSIQGIAVVALSDDVKVEKYNDAIKILNNTALPESAAINTNLFPSTINDFLKLPSILPYLDKNLDILDFNQQKARLISEASLASDNTEAFLRNLALAKFYFINEWYQESLDALRLAKQYSYNDYQVNLQARFLTAVNYTMIGEHAAAKEEYDSLLMYHDLQNIPELNLWSQYNEFALGFTKDPIGVVELLSNTMSLYSDDKYWPLVFAEIELALIANDIRTLDKIFREIRTPGEEKYANSLKYYKACYYDKKGQINLAKQYYKDLISQEADLLNRVRAEFDLVKLLIKNKEISTTEVIEILERLRFMWRGDQLEYQMLLQLAWCYRDAKDILNALRTFQYIQNAFANKVSNFYITSEMAKIFNDVFLPGGLGEEMDDFTVVALFYEFKELNPIGDQGDDVIIGIAKRLVRLDLLDNASELLRHQITYRLKGIKRVTNADNLAIILIMIKKPNEAILVLDETDKDNFDFDEHQYRVRLRARALISLEKYDTALSYLKDDFSEDAEIIRREALFQAKYWKRYVDQVSPNFEGLTSIVGSDMAAAQDILRLAIAYYMMNVHEQLVIISNAIGDKNLALKNTVDLLISSSGAVDYKNLDHSLDIDQMKTLLDKYKTQFLDK